MSEQGTTAKGWYPDPSGRHELRWWDGASWRDAVIDQGERSDDPLPPVQQAENKTTEVAQIAAAASDAHAYNAHSQSVDAGVSTGPLSAASGAKVTLFSAKKIATELQSENKLLHARVSTLEEVAREFGGLDAAEIALRIDALHQQESEQRARAAEHELAVASQIKELDNEVARAQKKLAVVEQDIIIARDRVELEARGLYDYEHVAEASASLATDLARVRSEIKQLNKYDRAIHATTGFTFNNSSSKGTTFVNQMRRIMLRAYNAEAENAVKTVKTGNLTPAIKRLSRAKEQIEKQGSMIDLAVDGSYQALPGSW